MTTNGAVKRYGAIYADPPWKFQTYGAGGLAHKAAETHYGTTATADLAALPVADWAADDSVLLMWIVDSHLSEALDLMRAWGFEYKTIAFHWVKTTKAGDPKMSLGYWTRKEAESCLLGTRGRPKRVGKGVRQVLLQPPREHSRKPDDFYARIEALTTGPYLEMFARQRRPGWDAWGNEVNKFSSEDVFA